MAAALLLCVLSIAAYGLVLGLSVSSAPEWVVRARQRAVARADMGQHLIRQLREENGLPLNEEDRLSTGLIGVSSSAITTELGSLEAKRTATNPVFAAAIVDMLYRAGIRRGNAVAVGMSGSFPGFNLATFAAIESMGATPIVITSVGSSQWGANEPSFSWLDMERLLYKKGVIHNRSIAAAAGGPAVKGDEESPLAALVEAAEASGLPVVPSLYPLGREVRYRMSLYSGAAERYEQPIKAFVNVGGAAANPGLEGSSQEFVEPGLSRPRWDTFTVSRLGVMGQMAARGIPIVNLVHVADLARRYGIEWDPARGYTALDLHAPPNRWAALVAVAGLFGALMLAHRGGSLSLPQWSLPASLRTGVVRLRLEPMRRVPVKQDPIPELAAATRTPALEPEIAPEPPREEWVSVTHASLLLGMAYKRVHQLVERGVLQSRHEGVGSDGRKLRLQVPISALDELQGSHRQTLGEEVLVGQEARLLRAARAHRVRHYTDGDGEAETRTAPLPPGQMTSGRRAGP
jgi:poly-gamma-glutamate system protein